MYSQQLQHGIRNALVDSHCWRVYQDLF